MKRSVAHGWVCGKKNRFLAVSKNLSEDLSRQTIHHTTSVYTAAIIEISILRRTSLRWPPRYDGGGAKEYT
jgi:hypothetical protein